MGEPGWGELGWGEPGWVSWDGDFNCQEVLACHFCVKAGVLKLFNQGAGARMKWQAVICGCLVSPPTPGGGGVGVAGDSVNPGGRIEDPGGLCLAHGP